MTFLYKWYN